MGEHISHHCGLCVTHTLHDAYSFIRALQHRGRDAVGIAGIGPGRIDAVKWIGTVETMDLVDLHKIMPSSGYHTFLAHVRYATKGSKRRLLEDAHPHVIGGEVTDYGSHVIYTGCEMVAVHNGHVQDHFLNGAAGTGTGTGSGGAAGDGTVAEDGDGAACDTDRLLQLYREVGEAELLRRVPGAYTMAIADRHRDAVLVLRDRTGIRPGVLGIKDGKHVVVSEDIALRKNGADFLEDLDPGAIYYFRSDGAFHKHQVVAPALAHCFFEWNYFADRDSIVQGLYVKKLRRALGEMLAEELDLDRVDFVSYFPRAPEDAARGLAGVTNTPFQPMFYKLRGERAFQGPTPDERSQSISRNIYLIPGVVSGIRGKSVLVVDDSIVRGNNIGRERTLLEKSGVSQVLHALYTPPIGIVGEDGVARGCLFGIDMPPNDTFFARGRNREQMAEAAGTQVVYLTTEGMLKVYQRLGIAPDNLCTYCIGGPYPYAKAGFTNPEPRRQGRPQPYALPEPYAQSEPHAQSEPQPQPVADTAFPR